MDEGRRRFLAYEVISGIKFLSIDGKRYKLVAPSKELVLLAEHIYKETIASLRFESLITKDKAELLLRQLKIWMPEDAEALKAFETYLEDRKIDLYQSMYDSERIKRMRRAIKAAKSGINKSLSKKHSLDYMTLEYHAQITKKKFLVALCLRDDTEQPIYTEKSFWNADSSIIEKAINVLEASIITVAEFREISRNDPWRSIWTISKEACLGIPSCDWTEDQRTVAAFAKMYDNAYQSMECPPDAVFEDDDMFDGWMLDQKRKREIEQKQKSVNTINNIPDKAQEVFLTAPTREDADRIYGMNDPDARMKIKQREQMILAHNGDEVRAQDLPDTALELRKQQMEEYKEKMKGGR